MSEYVALFDFHPSSDLELHLTAGAWVTVIEQNEDGWWKGTSEGHTGFFPRNYVRAKTDEAPALPPRPPSLLPPVSTLDGDVSPTTETVQTPTSKHLDYDTSVALGDGFALSSLDLFDALMNDGYCVDVKTHGSGPVVASNQQVSMDVKASVWDGAATVIHEFSEGKVVFTTGSSDCTARLPSGLVEAVNQLTVGSTALVTCTPSKAFGEAGNPPFVKANSHVVFKVTVLSAAPSSDSDETEAPFPFLKSGVHQAPKHRVESTRVASTRMTGVVFSDDALVAQALANGLSLSSTR